MQPVPARDRGGAESLRPSWLLRNDEPAARRLYFLGFGVSRYRESRLDLRFAHKDVIDLAAVLEHAEASFAEVRARVYLDDAVTPQAIHEARGFFAGAGVDDVVVLLVAGHGVHARDTEGRYYFVTHDTDVARLRETAAPFEELEALVSGIAPRSKLVLLDTCESGERDPDDVAASTRAGARGLSARAAVVWDENAPAVAPPRDDRDRYLYNDLLRRSGAVVLSSSRGVESSYESAELHNGIFTEVVMRALTSARADADGDGAIDVRELQRFVQAEVAALSGGAQNPVVDRDNLAAELALPVVAAALPIVTRASAPRPRYAADRPATQAAAPPPLSTPPGCSCAHAGGRTASAAALALVALALLVRRIPARALQHRERQLVRNGSPRSGRTAEA